MPAERKAHTVLVTRCAGEYGTNSICLNVGAPTSVEMAFQFAKSTIDTFEEVIKETTNTEEVINPIKGRIFIEALHSPATKGTVFCAQCKVNEGNHFMRIPPEDTAP